MGANWVSLAFRLYMPNNTANFLTKYSETPTDDEIRVFLTKCSQLNLNVMFKIIIHPQNDIPMNIAPENASLWFENYTAWNIYYAYIANEFN